jgi:hypothetical protein
VRALANTNRRRDAKTTSPLENHLVKYMYVQYMSQESYLLERIN